MNKLKFNLINKYRNYLKRVLTNNMGKVEETEDKIMCYVDSKMLNDSGFLLIDCCDKKKNCFLK